MGMCIPQPNQVTPSEESSKPHVLSFMVEVELTARGALSLLAHLEVCLLLVWVTLRGLLMYDGLIPWSDVLIYTVAVFHLIPSSALS
jgi:hypothetical protein